MTPLDTPAGAGHSGPVRAGPGQSMPARRASHMALKLGATMGRCFLTWATADSREYLPAILHYIVSYSIMLYYIILYHIILY
jgi:hypothetical protein